jgi:hypothetical protein
VLACAPGELHDLPLLAFGLALRARGWRITYLGADTPVDSLTEVAIAVQPTLVVVTATIPGRFRDLSGFSGPFPLALAGAGADERSARAAGARLLREGPVDAAERLTVELGAS